MRHGIKVNDKEMKEENTRKMVKGQEGKRKKANSREYWQGS